MLKDCLSFENGWSTEYPSLSQGARTDVADSLLPMNFTQVWWLSVTSLLRCYSQLSKYLDGNERLRAATFLREEDRYRFVIARASLRRILSSYLRLDPSKIRFATTEFGKPYLPDSHLHFNVSHSGDWAVIGIAGRPIGIDIEQICPIKELDSLVAECFSQAERKQLDAAKDQDKLKGFYRFWCRKEAYLKAIGRGFAHGSMACLPVPIAGSSACFTSDDVPEVRRWIVCDVRSPAGYAAAVVAGAVHSTESCRVRT